MSNISFSILFSLKSEDFVNIAHYKVCRRLLKFIEKGKIVATKTTKNYAVIVTHENSFLNYYIIGLDKTTNKYFINRIRNTQIVNINNDRDVFNLLNYDKDCDLENINIIDSDSRYRIQGDVIINVRSADDYITRLSHSIESHIYSILNYVVITRIMNLVSSEMHLNTRRVFDTIEVVISERVLRNYTKEQILESLINKLFELLNEYKEILFNDIISFLSNNASESIDLNITKTYNEIIIENAFMRIVIYIHIEGKFLIEMRITTNFKYENIIRNVLNSLKFTRHETMFGRHKIIFESAITNNLQIKIKLNLHEIDQTIINIHTHNAILVKDTITFVHPEHGTKEIKISDIKTVSLEHITNDLESEINSYNIVSLIKQQQNS